MHAVDKRVPNGLEMVNAAPQYGAAPFLNAGWGEPFIKPKLFIPPNILCNDDRINYFPNM